MATPAIRVEGLGKRYRLTQGQPSGGQHRMLRESLMGMVMAPFRKKGKDEEFWALDDLSFEVSTGEVVGIIGRNGAGKSTLLKILSRITKPTRGRVEINGRVGSLLEVGTGFHPELTGRENVYLNGSILGMSRREIAAKFDEIVAFAEVEKFLDTPVKRYSSGMYVRLAFAVAAHLEPEILIVDEVLAVGDVNFQKKCFSKMEEVGRIGRTVLVVSHDMTTLSRLCSRAVLLSAGKLQADKPTGEVVEIYLRESAKQSPRWERAADEADAGSIARLLSVEAKGPSGLLTETVDILQPLQIRMEYEVLESGWVLIPNIHLHNDRGVCLFVLHDWGLGWRRTPRPVGQYTSTVVIPGNFLSEGVVTVGAALTTYDPAQVVHFYKREVVSVVVTDSMDGRSSRGDYVGYMPGAVRPLFDWSTDGPEVQ